MHVVTEALSQFDLKSFKLCVACSGGLDSTVLLKAVIQMGFEPKILHINYQLRGEASEQDEAFVRELAEKHHLELSVIRCPKEVTKGNGINLQEAARTFRHKLFRQFIEESPNNRVLLAHHQDDQIETFFLQLLRGSGMFGLGGMHPERNGLIRPFLSLSKTDLYHYAVENGISWREDQSNEENNYKRNQFRNLLLPPLMESNPALKASVATIQSAFRATQEELRNELQNRLSEWERSFQISFAEWNRLGIEQQILCCHHFGWPFWILERIQGLQDSSLSSKIDNTPLFRTKDGFSWNANFAQIMQWEFKSEEVAFLPETFTPWEIYLDSESCEKGLIPGHAKPSDTIRRVGVNGTSKVFKLLKDSGIPEQWRTTYPVFRSGEEIVWVPGIAVSKKHLASPNSKLIIKVSRSNNPT